MRCRKRYSNDSGVSTKIRVETVAFVDAWQRFKVKLFLSELLGVTAALVQCFGSALKSETDRPDQQANLPTTFRSVSYFCCADGAARW
jgi:hypothetical protein